ncbi:MAG: dCTP deaminase [Phycisphaerae bacterium]
MSVVHRDEIARRLALPAYDKEALHLYPLHENALKDVDTVDVRLGHFFVLPTMGRTGVFDAAETDPNEMTQEVYVPKGGRIVVAPHHAVLGVTLEYMKLPADLSGQLLTRSSWARTFIVIATAPWVHPNYRGCPTLEIANLSNTAIELKPRDRIGQIAFIKCEGSTSPVAEDLEGTYMGAVRPEFPKFAR